MSQACSAKTVGGVAGQNKVYLEKEEKTRKSAILQIAKCGCLGGGCAITQPYI